MKLVELPRNTSDLDGDRHRALSLLSSLYRSLSHRIRTPLSVISNELACLDSEANEIGRSRRRCREIVDILDSVPRDALCQPSFDEISLSDLDIPGERPLQAKCLADAKLLQLAFQLFEAICVDVFRVRSALTADKIESDRLLLQTTINHAPYTPKAIKHSSLTEFFCNDLGLDAPTAPFIDAIMWAHGIEIQSISSTSTIFSFSIPVVNT